MTYFTPYTGGTWIEDVSPALEAPYGRKGQAIHSETGKLVEIRANLPDFSRCYVTGTPALAFHRGRWEQGTLTLSDRREIIFTPDGTGGTQNAE